MRPTWLPMTARILTGFVGGYILSAIVALFLAKALPAVRLEAVLTGAIINVIAIIWAFAARNTWRACLGILIPCALFGAITPLIR